MFLSPGGQSSMRPRPEVIRVCRKVAWTWRVVWGAGGGAQAIPLSWRSVWSGWEKL